MITVACAFRKAHVPVADQLDCARNRATQPESNVPEINMSPQREGPLRPRSGLRDMAEVNVTPLIDVLLVLLIIFMAALPISQKGLDVNLPEVAQPGPVPVPSPAIVLEYGADRRITINTMPVTLMDLETRLQEIFRTRHDRTLFVRGDGRLRYGEIIAVIDAARGAGVSRIGVVTDAALAAR